MAVEVQRRWDAVSLCPPHEGFLNMRRAGFASSRAIGPRLMTEKTERARGLENEGPPLDCPPCVFA